MEEKSIYIASELLKINDSDFWKLSNKDIATIMKLHGFKTVERDNQIYGYIEFYNTKTKETGEEETNLTGYEIDELKDYLGY